MPIHLRQICLVAESLGSVQADLEAVFGIRPAYHDDGVGAFGLENVLMPVGSQFIEVVAPVRENTAAGRFLDRRGGDGGYMVITQVATRADQDAARARAVGSGVRVAREADRATWKIMQLHPRDLGAVFFEIDWDDGADMTGNWMPAGGTGWRSAVATEFVDAITGVELQGPDPVAMAGLWGLIAASPVVMDSATPTATLANAVPRFLPDSDSRGPGLAGLELRATNAGRLNARADARGCRTPEGAIAVCGARFTIAS